MTPLEAYNKLNTAIELVGEVRRAEYFEYYTRPDDAIDDICFDLVYLRDSIKLPRQDAQVTLDSVKGGSESGEIG